MKKTTKLLAPVLALVLVLTMLFAAAPRANAEIYVADPGKTVTIYLEYTDICAIDGVIRVRAL